MTADKDLAGAHASDKTKSTLLVLASTYPRWRGDPEPGFVHELSRRLLAHFDVIVLCPHSPGAAEHEILDGVEVVRYRYAPTRMQVLVNHGGIVVNLRRRPWTWLLVPGLFLAQAWALRSVLRKRAAAVIHAHWLIPQGLVVATLARFGVRMPPMVVTSHGADLFALRGPLMDGLKRFVAARAHSLTVVSEGMRAAIGKAGIDPDKVLVEPMGVDMETTFKPYPWVPRSEHEILFVGRLVEKKGLKVLLQAMPDIIRARPQTRLTVVGFGPEEAARKRQAHELGISDRVTFVGAIPHSKLGELYRRASVFVAPFVEAASGDQEGLGLVVLEALACGCPVVVSRLPATAAFVAEVPAIQSVDPDDSHQLARVITETLASPPMVEQPAIARFNWRARADAYARILGRALERDER